MFAICTDLRGYMRELNLETARTISGNKVSLEGDVQNGMSFFQRMDIVRNCGEVTNRSNDDEQCTKCGSLGYY